MEKYCKHCHLSFTARRKNHVYCCSSCKTMASYKRNGYKYVSGHYTAKENNQQLVPSDTVNSQIASLDRKEGEFEKSINERRMNAPDIKNAVAGNLIADASVYGLKKLLAPDTLPATKGDIATLKKEIAALKFLIGRR